MSQTLNCLIPFLLWNISAFLQPVYGTGLLGASICPAAVIVLQVCSVQGFFPGFDCQKLLFLLVVCHLSFYFQAKILFCCWSINNPQLNLTLSAVFIIGRGTSTCNRTLPKNKKALFTEYLGRNCSPPCFADNFPNPQSRLHICFTQKVSMGSSERL